MHNMNPGEAPPWQNPDEWNDVHPIGTRVRVRKVNGECFEARSASRARPYGCSVVLELEGHVGCWLVTALTALD